MGDLGHLGVGYLLRVFWGLGFDWGVWFPEFCGVGWDSVCGVLSCWL